MTSDIAIRVQNLSKCYQIYDNPGDRLKQFVAPRIKRLLGKAYTPYFREFWALKDVSFEVKRGETVGIIGRNGSGKSTLLQIICGTLTPTGGTVQTNGRVAALLELGSGFNPEFTGRENVYLNAAVLGLSREEVDARFDKIAAFADIGEFIDQPVKIYSSGMYVKLAFAVIAHVDADILVIDEALAVGDAVFIQKCMRFIRAFQERGTLLFVSHDTASVQNLCESAIWLGNGQMKLVGTSKEVSEAYLQYTLQEVYGQEVKLTLINESTHDLSPDARKTQPLSSLLPVTTLPVHKYEEKLTVQDNLSNANGWKTGMADVTSLALSKMDGNTDITYEGGEKVCLTITAIAHVDLANPILGFIFKDRLAQDLFGENTLPFTATHKRTVKAGQSFTAQFEFKLPMLPNGQYVVMASVADGNLLSNIQHHYMHDAMVVHVSSSQIRWGLVGIPFSKVSLDVELVK
jgi:lipopolysaccharide transport system ATP-binding protein